MKEYWSKRIRDMVPYVPGEQPRDRKFIKLNTNENPYPPSPHVEQAIQALEGDALRLYPDPECMALRTAIARHNGIKPEQVFCGNGSDEVLSFAFQAFFDREDPITFPDITYSFYEVFVKYLNLTANIVPLKDDLTVPVEEFLSTPGGAVIANPNAPTGAALERGDLRKILDGNPEKIIVVDEAYVDFGAESMVRYINTYPNLLVIQTASKSRSLAGLRVGWAMGDENLINALRCVRDSINSYTVDRLAAAAAQAAIEDTNYFERTRRAVISTREETKAALKGLGFTVYPSQTNFLFVRHPDFPGKTLYDGLRARGILVRRWDIPRIKDHLRISVGTPEEMESLLKVLSELIRYPG